MATYSVHVPYHVAGLSRRADETMFIREGFSLGAFVFGPLYLLSRRLWLAALGWIVVAALMGGLAQGLDLPGPARVALFGLLALLTGFEAAGLRQSGLARRGYSFAAVVAAPTLDQAEHGFFAGEGLRAVPARPSAATGERAVAATPDVIGSLSAMGDA